MRFFPLCHGPERYNMKILVFSDSHGRRDRIRSAITEHLRYGPIERVFFLGDGIRDLLEVATEFQQIPFDCVTGNCDGGALTPHERALIPEQKVVCAGGFTFLLMHGHRYDVKSEYQYAADHAIGEKADVLLFGHTHRAEDVTIDGSLRGHVRMINPGPTAGWRGASYACLDIVGREIVCGFGSYEK